MASRSACSRHPIFVASSAVVSQSRSLLLVFSVASALGTSDFQRVRVGIGRPPGRKDPAAFVLENFTAGERPEVGVICEQAADATELLLELGLEPAQNTVHAW